MDIQAHDVIEKMNKKTDRSILSIDFFLRFLINKALTVDFIYKYFLYVSIRL